MSVPVIAPEKDQPPVARVLSTPPVSLPVRTAALDGSRSSDDKGGLSFLWSRDDSSPAAGVRCSAPPCRVQVLVLVLVPVPHAGGFVFQDVLNNSDHQAVLFLGNLVEGKYSFTLQVTDSKGQSSSDQGTVEVRPGRRPDQNQSEPGRGFMDSK